MSALDIDAIEARAKRNVVTCDECDAPATRVCNASECGATRCDVHAVEHSHHCDHRWYPRRSLAAEVLALVALARAQAAEIATLRATADDPLLDGTDGAHPAWWRGHDRAAEMLTAQRDAALADAASLRAVAVEYLALRDAVAAHDTSSRPFTDYAEFVLAIDKLTVARDALRAAIGGAP